MKKVTLWLTLLPLYLVAHAPATHMSVGAQTFDVWQQFDPEFYDYMITPAQIGEDSLLKMKTRKFYFIGLTMPDMLSPDLGFSVQSAIRSLIDTLYVYRSFCSDPLYIHTWTKDYVQTEISFTQGSSHNLQKLYEMANYAKQQGWTPYEKALIYGSLMHVVHDLYAHTFIQSSRFGYGKCYDSDSALSVGILFYGELYHEVFSQIYLTGWTDFIGTLYTSVVNPNSMPIFRYEGFGFYREYTIDGNYFLGWQQLAFPPIVKYVGAANAVDWQIENLNAERLKAYLHGWAMVLFMVYGFRRDGGGCGGMFAHPTWDTEYLINEFWANMGIEDYLGPPWYLDWLPWPIQDALRSWALNLLRNKLLEKVPPDNYEWPSYFESLAGLDHLWEILPPEHKQKPSVALQFARLHRNLGYWKDTDGNRIKEPRLRSSYSDEYSLASQFDGFYKASVEQGPSYLDNSYNGIHVFGLARKAGLLGGLYDVSSPSFSRQPGIIDLHYCYVDAYDQRQHVYTYIETESTPIGGVEWDMIVFPTNLRVRLMGRKADGTTFQLGYPSQYQYQVNTYERKQHYLVYCRINNLTFNY